MQYQGIAIIFQESMSVGSSAFIAGTTIASVCQESLEMWSYMDLGTVRSYILGCVCDYPPESL
jgi:hypothetical protein